MKNELTPRDWNEIFYAVEDKLTSNVVKGNDATAIAWRKHLKSILEKLGKDGSRMYDPY